MLMTVSRLMEILTPYHPFPQKILFIHSFLASLCYYAIMSEL